MGKSLNFISILCVNPGRVKRNTPGFSIVLLKYTPRIHDYVDPKGQPN